MVATEEEVESILWSAIAEEIYFRRSATTPRHFHPAIKECFLTYSAHTPVDRVGMDIIHTCELDIPVKDLLLPDGSDWDDSTKVVDTLLQTFCDFIAANACPNVHLKRTLTLFFIKIIFATIITINQNGIRQDSYGM